MSGEIDISRIRPHKDRIIEEWCGHLLARFPDVYGSAINEMQKQAGGYFDFLLDFHIPVEQHPIMSMLHEWVNRLVIWNVPLVHSLYSSHYFRDAMFDVVCALDPGEVPYPLFKRISQRIDSFERMVTEIYSEISLSLIREKDSQIMELHADRINIVGKMAASFAHELRNPLTAIGGFLKLIRRQLPSEALKKVENYLDYIQIEFDNFQMQITGFLSFSKRRTMEEELSAFQVRQLIDYVLTMNMPHVLNENIQLEVEIETDTPIWIQRVGMQQVLSNLLHNGIEALSGVDYEKKMSIRVWEAEKRVHISVSNNGPEIPVKLRDTLFSPFVTGKKDGTGLGLAICKQIVDKNGGAISFTTGREETRFLLSFPIRMSAESMEKPDITAHEEEMSGII